MSIQEVLNNILKNNKLLYCLFFKGWRIVWYQKEYIKISLVKIQEEK